MRENTHSDGSLKIGGREWIILKKNSGIRDKIGGHRTVHLKEGRLRQFINEKIRQSLLVHMIILPSYEKHAAEGIRSEATGAPSIPGVLPSKRRVDLL